MSLLLDEPASAAAWCLRERAAGRTLGFVPTMGALHAGHLALVRRSVAECERTVVSVFVNPLQFDDPRDFERYPRDLARDAALVGAAGAALVFTGTLASFFPGELDAQGRLPGARLLDPGPAAHGLEGAFRAGHFAGVATIVARLFELVQPTRAYFGQKDYQQTRVVRALVATLDERARASGERVAAPQIVVCPTVREPSGLALSSRNALLDDASRDQALALQRALRAADQAWRAGERERARLESVLARSLAGAPGVSVEYAAVRDPERWGEEAPRGELAQAVALVAARVGGVRLIDNHLLGEAFAAPEPAPAPRAP